MKVDSIWNGSDKMKKLIVLLVVGLMSGCASNVEITKTKEGILFESNRQFDASYREGEIEASASTKGKGLLEGMIQPAGMKLGK